MFVDTPSKRYSSDKRYGSDKIVINSSTVVKAVVKALVRSSCQTSGQSSDQTKISLVGRNVLVVGGGHSLVQRSVLVHLGSDFQ